MATIIFIFLLIWLFSGSETNSSSEPTENNFAKENTIDKEIIKDNLIERLKKSDFYSRDDEGNYIYSFLNDFLYKNKIYIYPRSEDLLYLLKKKSKFSNEAIGLMAEHKEIITTAYKDINTLYEMSLFLKDMYFKKTSNEEEIEYFRRVGKTVEEINEIMGDKIKEINKINLFLDSKGGLEKEITRYRGLLDDIRNREIYEEKIIDYGDYEKHYIPILNILPLIKNNLQEQISYNSKITLQKKFSELQNKFIEFIKVYNFSETEIKNDADLDLKLYKMFSDADNISHISFEEKNKMNPTELKLASEVLDLKLEFVNLYKNIASLYAIVPATNYDYNIYYDKVKSLYLGSRGISYFNEFATIIRCREMFECELTFSDTFSFFNKCFDELEKSNGTYFYFNGNSGLVERLMFDHRDRRYIDNNDYTYSNSRRRHTGFEGLEDYASDCGYEGSAWDLSEDYFDSFDDGEPW